MKSLRSGWDCLLAGVGLLRAAREPSHRGTGDCGDPVAPRAAVLPLPLLRLACRWHEVARGRGAQPRPQSPGNIRGAGLIPGVVHGGTRVKKKVTLGRDLHTGFQGKEGRAFEVRVRVQGTSQEGLCAMTVEQGTQAQGSRTLCAGGPWPSPPAFLGPEILRGGKGRGSQPGTPPGPDRSQQRQEISNF